MSEWINLTTIRGDIILKLVDESGNIKDVQNVEDLKQLLSESNFIYALEPMSPKATPRLIKVGPDGAEEHFTEEEEEQAALGVPPLDKNGEPYMIKRDSESMRISYTGVGSVFNSKNIVINSNQIISACLMVNQEELDNISRQVYSGDLQNA
jgi:hypothetical protein